MISTKQIQSKIVKKDNKYQVQSEKGKNLGTYNTRAEAEKRLKQVEMFKHMNSELQYDYGDNPLNYGIRYVDLNENRLWLSIYNNRDDAYEALHILKEAEKIQDAVSEEDYHDMLNQAFEKQIAVRELESDDDDIIDCEIINPYYWIHLYL